MMPMPLHKRILRGAGKEYPVKKSIDRFRKSEDTLVRVFRNSAWLFSAKGIGAVLSIFYLAVLTRTLGPEGFGEFILIVSIVHVVFSLLHFETWQSVVHFGVPRLLAKDKLGFSQLAAANILIEMAGSLATLTILITALPIFAQSMGWDEQQQTGALVYGLFVCFAMRSSAIGILRADDRFRDGAVGDTMIPVVRLTGALILLAMGPNLIGFLIVWGLSEFASALALWGLVIIRKVITLKGINAQGIRASLKSEPDYFRFLISTNFTYVLNMIRERLVVVIVGLYVSVSAAGLFRLADQLANSVNRLAEIFARPLFAELSRLYAAGDKPELRRLFFRSLRISAISGGAMFGLLVLIGEPIILTMSGEAFLGAYPLLILLGAATIFGLAGLGLEPLLQAAGKAHHSLIIRVTGLVILAGSLAILLPIYGVMGAAMAMVGSAAVILIIMLCWSWREIRSLR